MNTVKRIAFITMAYAGFGASAQQLLLNPSFEVGEAASAGWPNGYGYWRGDLNNFVGPEAGIVPKEGGRMLKFLATNGESTGLNACDVWQLVDLSALRPSVTNGHATLTWSIHVNRVAVGTNTDTGFVMNLYAFSSSPSLFPGGDVACKSYDRFTTDGDPSTWERVSVSLHLPTNALYVGANVSAIEDVVDDHQPPEFNGHYADDGSVSFSLAAYPQPLLTAIHASEGAIRFQLYAEPGRYAVEYTDRLTSPNWTPFLTNVVSSTVPIVCVDTNFTGAGNRFYRAVEVCD